eukprot:TRINITY_DN12458_c0_g1_i1.p1 TRINITY_DN12458_c0_g1~~TRINITY_DN12458_c0_g1_i1.p1  ORF type:complete len:317 (-),score=56.91 TRINITY_DN12458_c0_g1_i1:90-1040(-)
MKNHHVLYTVSDPKDNCRYISAEMRFAVGCEIEKHRIVFPTQHILTMYHIGSDADVQFVPVNECTATIQLQHDASAKSYYLVYFVMTYGGQTERLLLSTLHRHKASQATKVPACTRIEMCGQSFVMSTSGAHSIAGKERSVQGLPETQQNTTRWLDYLVRIGRGLEVQFGPEDMQDIVPDTAGSFAAAAAAPPAVSARCKRRRSPQDDKRPATVSRRGAGIQISVSYSQGDQQGDASTFATLEAEPGYLFAAIGSGENLLEQFPYDPTARLVHTPQVPAGTFEAQVQTGFQDAMLDILWEGLDNGSLLAHLQPANL